MGPTIGVLTMEIVPARWRPLMAAVIQLATALTAVLIGIGGGWLITLHGYQVVFLAGACVTAAGGLLFLGARRTLQRLASEHQLDPSAEEQPYGPVASSASTP